MGKSRELDGEAELREMDSHDVRDLERLGPFGSGNPRPVFLTRDVKIVGNPTVDYRGRDLSFRVVKDGVLLPAKLHLGARHFEELRNQKDSMTMSYSPRLNRRAVNGPVHLQVWQMSPLPNEGPTRS
jgi:single-stranded-DNA-specific exonuclease